MSLKSIEWQTAKPRKNKQGSLKDKGCFCDSPRPPLEIKRAIKLIIWGFQKWNQHINLDGQQLTKTLTWLNLGHTAELEGRMHEKDCHYAKRQPRQLCTEFIKTLTRLETVTRLSTNASCRQEDQIQMTDYWPCQNGAIWIVEICMRHTNYVDKRINLVEICMKHTNYVDKRINLVETLKQVDWTFDKTRSD